MIQVAQFRIESSRAGRRTTYQQKGKEFFSNTEASTTTLAVVSHGLRCLVKRQAVDTSSKAQRLSRDRSLQSVQNSPEDGSRLRSEFTSSCSQAQNEGPWSTGHILEASKTRCSSAKWCNEHRKTSFPDAVEFTKLQWSSKKLTFAGRWIGTTYRNKYNTEQCHRRGCTSREI